MRTTISILCPEPLIPQARDAACLLGNSQLAERGSFQSLQWEIGTTKYSPLQSPMSDETVQAILAIKAGFFPTIPRPDWDVEELLDMEAANKVIQSAQIFTEIGEKQIELLSDCLLVGIGFECTSLAQAFGFSRIVGD